MKPRTPGLLRPAFLITLASIAMLLGAPQGALAQTNTFPSSGNTGLGTTSPAALLDIQGGGVSINGPLGGGPIGANVTAIDNQSWGARFMSYGPNSSTPGTIILHQGSSDNSVYRDAVVVDSEGNVGIGTWSPSDKLHVVGNITVTGNIAAKYQDIAEWVPSRENVPSGSVVVLDQTQSNAVIGSTTAYDTKVAGVVSPQPGLILGEQAEGRLKIATTGRVKVRVDASVHPIEVGDLLVTSEKPGTAMKSETVKVGGIEIHRPGTILGKALEPLPAGEGEILVLLSLQ